MRMCNGDSLMRVRNPKPEIVSPGISLRLHYLLVHPSGTASAGMPGVPQQDAIARPGLVAFRRFCSSFSFGMREEWVWLAHVGSL